MKILLHSNFEKNYLKRIISNSTLDYQFKNRFAIFKKNPSDPILKNHRLQGKKKSYFSFSITGDIRVLYKKIGDTIIFYDIGSHNQVY